MKPCTTLAALAALALAAGCASFRSTQKDAFVDDDGNILVVEYGSLSRSYAYKLVSPINGAEVECTDNRAVRVTLPDETGAPNGETMTLRICQNDSPKGTTYATKDGKRPPRRAYTVKVVGFVVDGVGVGKATRKKPHIDWTVTVE